MWEEWSLILGVGCGAQSQRGSWGQGGENAKGARIPFTSEVPGLETRRACSVAAAVLGDETLLVGAEVDVQCLGEAAGEAEHGSP